MIDGFNEISMERGLSSTLVASFFLYNAHCSPFYTNERNDPSGMRGQHLFERSEW